MKELEKQDVAVLYHNQLENYDVIHSDVPIKFLIERRNLINTIERVLSQDILKFLNLEVPVTEADSISYLDYEKVDITSQNSNMYSLAEDDEDFSMVSYNINMKMYRPSNRLIPLCSFDPLKDISSTSNQFEREEIIINSIKALYSRVLFKLFKESYSDNEIITADMTNTYMKYKEVADKDGISEELFNLMFPEISKINIDKEIMKLFYICEKSWFELFGRGKVTDFVCSNDVLHRLMLSKLFKIENNLGYENFCLRGSINGVNIYVAKDIANDEAYALYNDRERDSIKEMPGILSIDTPFFIDLVNNQLSIYGDYHVINKSFVKKVKLVNLL